MIVAPVGSMPTPVAAFAAVPAIAPVAAPTPSGSQAGDGGDAEARHRDRAPLYDRHGRCVHQEKGRLVSRQA